MTNRHYEILLIDDDEDDYISIGELLKDIGSSTYSVTWVSSYTDGLEALKKKKFDACLLDYKLGEKTGLDLLAEAKKRTYSYPVIFLTGMGDFELDVEAMRLGASDYLAKDQLTFHLLERSIRYSIKQASDLEELRQTKAQILQQDRLASLGLLASSLAHEIGTPLGIIRSRAELAAKRAGDNLDVQNNVSVVVTQIDKIAKLVNSLLHLARGEKSNFTTSIELDSVIQDILNLVEHELGRKGIELQKNITPHLRLRAESSLLGQVLLNLLINSIHAIEEKKERESSAQGKVALKVEDIEGAVKISVQDNGVGISEENQRELFKPFFTTKNIGHGTGLGLATSFSIIKSWGGTISVVSNLGEGTTFSIVIPKYK